MRALLGGAFLKYGIDISNNLLKNKIYKELRFANYSVVNCSNIIGCSIGDELFRKVTLANQTKIDFYLSINECDEIENNEIMLFLGYDNKTLNFFESFSKNIKNTCCDNLKIRDVKNFYLFKNIKATTVIFKISRNISCEALEKLSNSIINTLLSLS